MVSLGISGIIALTTPLPAPQFHDEFSYLLAADTFARWRLTNPPHPRWEFFETFHVIHQPTYMSKYPPAQGLFLALGQVLFGLPIVGVWISTALACAALTWGLAGLVPRRWALVGGLIAATHPLMLSWNWSFWGGAVAAMGGALVVGGIARWHTRSLSAGLLLGIGIFILAISRPFEGIIFSLLSIWLLRAPSPRHSPVRLRSPQARGRGGMVALTVTLVLGATWIGYYNWRITRNPLALPYQVYESRYAITPPFVWAPWSGAVPQYRHAPMREFYTNWWLDLYQRQRTLAGFCAGFAGKAWTFVRGYFWSAALVVPAVFALFALRRDRLLRRALIVSIIFTVIVLNHLGFFAHYASACAAVYLLIAIGGLRHLRAECRRIGGRWMARGIVAAHLIACFGWIVSMNRTADAWNFQRAGEITRWRQTGLKYIVIVRPSPGLYTHNEWVFNDADIDSSPIVWARDMGGRNQLLLDYFPDRQAILLEIDERSMRFSSYPR